ncbi:MAG TPA: serine protease [Acidimicrobiales bacterium]|nr:serine protease [Acidimicrobiales bacterium]
MTPSAPEPGSGSPRPEVPRPPPPRTGQTATLTSTGAPVTSPPVASAPVDGPKHMRNTEERPKLRHRVLPRTAIGISVAILFFAFGAALSGTVLYSYYEYRLTQNEDKVSALTNGLPKQVQQAESALKAQEANAQRQIADQLAPLRSELATGQTVQALAAKAAPALYFVHTLDASGQPAVGSAFAVASDSRQTLLLTSYAVVAAATRQPGPQVFVRHGTDDEPLTVYTWDEAKDLALLILPKGGQPTLAFAPSAPQIGERVFAVSGLGSAGASVTQGFVADVSADGIQHDATVGAQFQGGPLLNSDGTVVGVLSRSYSPLGFTVADVWFAVPPSGVCARVLSCAGGTPTGGATAGATPPSAP